MQFWLNVSNVQVDFDWGGAQQIVGQVLYVDQLSFTVKLASDSSVHSYPMSAFRHACLSV